AYWADRMQSLPNPYTPLRIVLPSYFLAFLLSLTLFLINYSPFSLGKKSAISRYGEDDFTQDMYGWQQINEAFKKISFREEQAGTMPKDASLISTKWFPAAHLDFYCARPNKRELFAIGSLTDIHKYAWINQQRKGLHHHGDYYYIAVSNYYKNPSEIFEPYFQAIEPMDTVKITRAGEVVRYAFFFRLKNYNGNFINPLTQ
ncbi:MAG: hypothetical protein ACKO96_18580, partial [Flammeovirgaceae bacterium]